MTGVAHATIALERTYATSADRVYFALTDTGTRLRWAPPDQDQEFVFDATDFRVGGTDLSRCGPAGDLMFSLEGHYLDIVPERRIVFSETVSGPDGRLSASLVTFEIEPDGPATTLRLTVQVASFAGEDMIKGNRQGWAAALRNIETELNRQTAKA